MVTASSGGTTNGAAETAGTKNKLVEQMAENSNDLITESPLVAGTMSVVIYKQVYFFLIYIYKILFNKAKMTFTYYILFYF